MSKYELNAAGSE